MTSRQRRRLDGHAVEIGRSLDVLGFGIPLVAFAGVDFELRPVDVAAEDVGVLAPEHLFADAARHRFRDLVVARPEVVQVDGFAVVTGPDRLSRQIDVHPSGQRVRDDQRRRREIIGADLRVDASFEVAIAGEHGGNDHVLIGDALGNVGRQRSRISDAGRASVTDQLESELIEIRLQAGGGEIVGNDLRAGRKRRFDPRLGLQAAFDGVARQQTGADQDRRIRRVGTTGDRRDNYGTVVKIFRGARDRRGAAAAFVLEARYGAAALFARRDPFAQYRVERTLHLA